MSSITQGQAEQYDGGIRQALHGALQREPRPEPQDLANKIWAYEIDIRQIRRGKLVIGSADGRVFADGNCVYQARDRKVSLISAEI